VSCVFGVLDQDPLKMDVVLAVQQYVARMTEGVSGMKALLLDKEVFVYVNTYMPTVWHVMLCCARRAPGEMFPNGENLGLCIVDACSLAHAHKLTHIYAHTHTHTHTGAPTYIQYTPQTYIDDSHGEHGHQPVAGVRKGSFPVPAYRCAGSRADAAPQGYCISSAYS